jgi:hypothetical protein
LQNQFSSRGIIDARLFALHDNFSVRPGDEWIEQPEFHVLNVCFVKIDLCPYCGCDTCPIGGRVIRKQSVTRQVWIVIVGTSFAWVIGNVENRLPEISRLCLKILIDLIR